jgi:hypothetical protein
MRRKLIISLIIFGIIVILGIGFWAFKSGKFAGLADVIKSSPTPTQVIIHVQDNYGKSMQSVDIQMSTDNNYYQSVGQTDSSGNFAYNAYQSDGAILYFRALFPMYTSSPEYQKITINHSNPTQNLTFILTAIQTQPSKGGISGHVTGDGKPLYQAQVSLYDTQNNPKGINVWTQPDGSYILSDNLDPGTYNVAAWKDYDYPKVIRSNVVVQANQVAIVDFALSSGANPSPSSSTSYSPPPSPPDQNKFIYMVEVVDSQGGQLIKGVEVDLTINPPINGATGFVGGQTQDKPIDSTKYGNSNLVGTNVPRDSYCYGTITTYTVTFKHDAFEDVQRTFTCQDIKLSTSLNSYTYNNGRVSLNLKSPTEFYLRGRVYSKVTNEPLEATIKIFALDSPGGKPEAGQDPVWMGQTHNVKGRIGKYNYVTTPIPLDQTKTYQVLAVLPLQISDFLKEVGGIQFSYLPSNKFSYALGQIKFDPLRGHWFAQVDIAVDFNALFKATVIDDASKKPIADARVELQERGVNFDLVENTNLKGEALFYSAKIIDYCTSKLSSKKPNVIVSASGYTTIIQGVSICDTHSAQFSLVKKDDSHDTKIKGKVVDNSDSNSEPVKDAKVSLFKNPPVGTPFRFVTTDANGYFEFNNLSAGEYNLSAFHIDYVDTPSNWQVVNLKAGDEVFVVLEIEKITKNEPVANFAVEVLRSVTLEPIQGITVKLSGEKIKEVITKTTEKDGYAPFLGIAVGQNAKVQVGKTQDGKFIPLAEKTVNLPQNWNNLDNQTITKILNQFVFIIDDGGRQGRVEAKIKFLVQDEKNSSPLEGAAINIEVADLDFNFAATTNNQGIALFPDNFQFTDPEGEVGSYPAEIIRQIKNFKIYTGEFISVKVIKNGYEEYSSTLEIKNQDETKTIKLTPKKPVLRIIIENYSLYNSSYSASKLSLEKREVNSYTKTSDRGNRESETSIIYDNLKPGYYRVAYTDNLPSETVYFNGKKDAEIRYSFCNPDSKLEKIGDDLYYLLSDDEAKSLYQANSSFFNLLAGDIIRLKNQSQNLRPLIIEIGAGGKINGAAILTGFSGGCLQIEDPYVIQLTNEYVIWAIGEHRTDDIIFTIYHEYGHLDYTFELSNANPHFFSEWQWIWSELDNSPDRALSDCVFQAIKDGNVNLSPDPGSGHPADDDNEMFASFFAAYFNYHERLHGIIRYHVKENSSCQNLLKYMWQLFSEDVGKVYDNDDQIFDPVGGKIGNSTYNWDQILSGKWINSNYQKLSYLEKAYIQFERTIGPVIGKAVDSLKNAVQAFNNWLDRLLNSLGITDVGNLSGTLKNADNQVLTNTVIMIGPRAAMTDGTGRFTANRIPAGSQPIKVKKSTAEEYIVVAPVSGSVVINKGQTLSQNIQVR